MTFEGLGLEILKLVAPRFGGPGADYARRLPFRGSSTWK